MLTLTRVVFALVLVLALVACGGGAATPAAPAADAPPAAAATPADTATDADDDTDDAASSPERPTSTLDPQELINQAIDPVLSEELLSGLQSYRITTEGAQITRSSDGNTETRSSYLEERINDPLTIRTLIAGDPNSPPNETIISTNTLFQIRPDSCETSQLDQEGLELTVGMARSMLSMGMMFAASGTPELVAQGVMVNGVSTDHYQVRSEDTTFAVSADMWLAPEGYLVKLDSITQIGNPDDASSASLETRFSYNLEAINAISSIAVPDQCSAVSELASGDLPILPDARNSIITNDLVSYTTDVGRDDIVAFYTEQLSADGYTVEQVTDNETLLILAANRPGRQLELIIGTGNADGNVVSISIRDE